MAAIAWLLSKTLLIIYTRVCVSVSVCARQREAECVAGVVQWVNGAKQRGVRATHACVCSLLLGEPTTLRPATFTMSGLLLAASTPLSLSLSLCLCFYCLLQALHKCGSKSITGTKTIFIYMCVCVCVCAAFWSFVPVCQLHVCLRRLRLWLCLCVCVCVEVGGVVG